MKLFLLTRIEHADWDEYEEKLIRSTTHKQARIIANQHVGDEGRIWEDAKLVKCEVLKANGEEGVVMLNFNAG